LTCEVDGELADLLLGRRGAGFHPLQSAERASQLVERQAGQDGFGPLVCLQRAIAELRVRGPVDMLGAVVVPARKSVWPPNQQIRVGGEI
jgi:hypothetical protein